MPYVATKGPYTLILRKDDDPPNPRADYDNFGTMTCFHRRHTLGDKHDHDSPADFLRALARETVPAKDVCDFAIAEKAGGVELKYNGEAWDVISYSDGDWYLAESFPGPIAGQEDAIAETLLDEMGSKSLLRLAELHNIILPLNLYDHSGLSMSTMSFHGRAPHAEWDSGQVGWIHVTKAKAQAEFGDEVKAAEALESEVATYDSYLRGECYGFELYKGAKETDSCWGFIGDPASFKADVEGYLPDKCKGIMDALEYRSGRADIEPLLLPRGQDCRQGAFHRQRRDAGRPAGKPAGEGMRMQNTKAHNTGRMILMRLVHFREANLGG